MKYKKWTEDIYKQVEMLVKEGHTARQVAKMLDLSEDGVKRAKVTLKLSSRKGFNNNSIGGPDIDSPVYFKYLEYTATNNISIEEFNGSKGQSLLKCGECGKEWRSRLNDLERRKQTCTCKMVVGTSKVCTKWLDSLGIIDREYLIPGTLYRVDGICKESGTAYEFLGDFWHGNLEIYDLNEVNPINNRIFEDLFIQTIKRLEEIRLLGYKIVYIWETEYRKGLPPNKF
jgi:hypothetical protein